MKKSIKIILTVIVGMVIAVSLFFVSKEFLSALQGLGIIGVDNSVRFEEIELHWNDTVYIPSCGEFIEGKIIARTNNGWDIDAVEGDSSHNFVVARTFLEWELYVRKDYVIPKSGEVTAIYWNGRKITDAEFCRTVDEIYKNNGNTFEYQTEYMGALSESQHMKKLYFSYEGCPVGTSSIGYMGILNGKWIITIDIKIDDSGEYGSYKSIYICKEIPDQYVPALKRYFS